jgi:hypothetical protein
MVTLMAMSAFGQGTPRSYYGGGHTHTRFNIEFGYNAILIDGVMVRSTLANYIYNYLMPQILKKISITFIRSNGKSKGDGVQVER